MMIYDLVKLFHIAVDCLWIAGLIFESIFLINPKPLFKNIRIWERWLTNLTMLLVLATGFYLAIDVQWSVLKGRNVYYLLHEFYNKGRVDICKIAMAAYIGMKRAGVEPIFLSATESYNVSEFIQFAKLNNVTEDSIATPTDKTVAGHRILKGISDIGEIKEQQYILRPAIPLNSITLLYSATGD